jgi:hypothetical protein
MGAPALVTEGVGDTVSTAAGVVGAEVLGLGTGFGCPGGRLVL